MVVQAEVSTMTIHAVFILSFCLTCLAANQHVSNLNSAVGEFSFNLLGRTVKGDENTVHSAYSIVSGLGICLLGARDETFKAMRSTMSLQDLQEDELKDAFKASIEQVFQRNNFTLQAANRVYVNSSYTLGSVFQNQVKEIFSAEAHNVNFKGEFGEVQQSINEFVKEQTKGLIPQMLKSPLDKETVMALVNALYFKASWPRQFGFAFTDEQFNAHTCETTQPIVSHQKADWLQTRNTFRYVESPELQATLVELSYRSDPESNQNASMIIILPSESHRCGLSEWVNSHLKWSVVVNALKAMKPTEVIVRVPRFEIESDFELSKVLSDMGMQSAFSDLANFNGMLDSGTADLKIDEVIHKARVTIDEQGTEASAATVATIQHTRLGAENLVTPKEVYINRSFVALVILRQQEDSFLPIFTSVVNKLN